MRQWDSGTVGRWDGETVDSKSVAIGRRRGLLMRRWWFVTGFALLIFVSCARPAGQLRSVAELSERTAAGAPVVTVFKAPT